MTLYGIDVSHYQSSLSLRTAKEQGYSFAMAKVTEGTGYYDPTYTKFRDEAKAEGLFFAAYHYLRSDSSGDKQAAWCASKLGDKSIPVMVDMESGSGGSTPKMIHCTDFIKGLAVRGVRATLLYLPQWYWEQIGKPGIPALALVSSKYGNNDSGYASALYPGDSSSRWSGYGGKNPLILQFGSKGKYSGYSGAVDINAFRGTVTDLRRQNVFKDYDPPIVKEPTVAISDSTRINYIDGRVEAMTKGLDKVRTGFNGEGTDVWLVKEIKALSAKVDKLAAAVDALKQPPA